MNGYDPKYWKHGVNVTVGQFCDYVKKHIPSDAVFYICGDNNVSLHFSPEDNIFSADYDALSDLPEYEGYEAREIETARLNGNRQANVKERPTGHKGQKRLEISLINHWEVS